MKTMYRFALVNGLSVSWIQRCIELVHRKAQRAYGPQLIPFGARNETYKALQTELGRYTSFSRNTAYFELRGTVPGRYNPDHEHPRN